MNKHVAAMIGRRFGELTVLAHHSRTEGYLCCCDCGKETVAKTHALKTGRHRSCGCKNRGPRPQARKPDHLSAKKAVFNNYRRAAKTRGYEFQLTLEEFSSLIVQACHYCGSAPRMSIRLKAHLDFRFNGVDRVENAQGYTATNSVPCCDICNNSKSTLSLEAWLAWIARVHQFQQERSTTIPSGSTPKRAEMGATPRG